MPTEEDKWSAEFEELGLTEVRRRISVGGFSGPRRKTDFAIRWSAAKERADLSRANWAIAISIIALFVSILGFLYGLYKG